MSTPASGWYPGKTCTCGAQPPSAPCDTTDCREPWAQQERSSQHFSIWDRVVAFFVAVFGWR